MSKGMRGMLAAAACLACVTAGFAGEPAAHVRCKICVLRLTDECVEKLAQCNSDERPCCDACPAATARPKSCCADDASKKCCRRDQGCPTDCASKAQPGHCCSADGCAARCATPACGQEPMVLKPRKANRWLELVRECKDCEVVCCPTVMVLSGQTAHLQMGSPAMNVTGSCRSQVNGEECDVTVHGVAMTGCFIAMRAMANLDNQSVTVSMTCQRRECLPGPKSCCNGQSPRSTGCCPASCDQKPRARARSWELSRTFVCPVGCTVVLEANRSEEDRGCDSEVPFLSDLPVVGELFRCKSSEKRCDRLIVLVTPALGCDSVGEESTTDTAANPADDVPLFAMPVMCGDWQRVIPPPPVPVAQWMASPPVAVARCLPAAPPMAMEFLPVMPRVVAGRPLSPPAPQAMVRPVACPAPAVPSSPDAELVSLMIEYYEACAAGENIKARNLAARCIAIDPTCFAR